MPATWTKAWTHAATGEEHSFTVTLTLGWCKVLRHLEADGTPAGTRRYRSLLPPLKARQIAARLEADGFKRATAALPYPHDPRAAS